MSEQQERKKMTDKQIDGLVICDSVLDKCDLNCPHQTRHLPIFDKYGDNVGYCNDIEESCGYRADSKICLCVEI